VMLVVFNYCKMHSSEPHTYTHTHTHTQHTTHMEWCYVLHNCEQLVSDVNSPQICALAHTLFITEQQGVLRQSVGCPKTWLKHMSV